MVCVLYESLDSWGWDLPGYERLAYNFLYHFKVKTCFFCSFTRNSHAYQLTFHHALWKQHPKSNQNIPNHYITIRQFFMCLNCIPPIKFYFTKLDFCSIMCRFLVNNLHLIRYYNHIVQPHWKKFSWNKMLLMVYFPSNSPMFWLTNKIAF